MADRDVPFSTVLKVLESEGYTLLRIAGDTRVFMPPAGSGKRLILFPVIDKTVRYNHVKKILRTIDEDKRKD